MRYLPPLDERPSLMNQAQRTPNRAIAPRRLDYINIILLAADVETSAASFHRRSGRITEFTQLDNGTLGGC